MIANTRENILELAYSLIKVRGFNAFSFHDLSKIIGIKTASIHYHFPTKTDLVVAVIKKRQEELKILREKIKSKNPFEKLESFFAIYSQIRESEQVCLVGSLTTDLNTLDEEIKNELKNFTDIFLEWVTEILEEGKKAKIFHFKVPARTKALMIISSMLAAVQLSRLYQEECFKTIKNSILADLQK